MMLPQRAIMAVVAERLQQEGWHTQLPTPVYMSEQILKFSRGLLCSGQNSRKARSTSIFVADIVEKDGIATLEVEYLLAINPHLPLSPPSVFDLADPMVLDRLANTVRDWV